MRIRGRAALVTTVLVLCCSALTACGAAPATGASAAAAPASPRLTPTPIFTSDADALAAATEVYTKYVRASDDVGHDGGQNPERVRPFASDALVESEREHAQKLIEAGARSYGSTKVSNTKLQSVEYHDGLPTIAMYVCEDLREVDVRDSDGKSLIADSRSDFVAYVVTVEMASSGRLVVTADKFWAGGGVCD